MPQKEYNYQSLFNVLSEESINFEALKRELRPILKDLDNQNTVEIIQASASRLPMQQKHDLGQWVWNYVPKDTNVELAAIEMVLDAISELNDNQKKESLIWVCDKLVDKGSTSPELAAKAFSFINILPSIDQHTGAYNVWRITPESAEELELNVLQKALDTIEKAPIEQQMGNIKWVCKKTPHNHKLHVPAYTKAVQILETLPEAEQFEEAQWIFNHAREKSRAAGQAHKKAAHAVSTLSIEQQTSAKNWVLENVKPGSTFAKQAEKLLEKTPSKQNSQTLSHDDFLEKLTLAR